MKKLLFILTLILISLMGYGQATDYQGRRIGATGTVIDSLKLESGIPHMYFSATDVPLANADSIPVFRDSIDDVSARSISNTTLIGTNATNISDNSVAISANSDDISDNIDSLIIHDGKININLQSAVDNSDSIDASGVLIGTNIDNIITNTDDVSTSNSDISNLQGNTVGVYGFTFTFSNDTMIVSSGGVEMKFTKASGTEEDVISPTIKSVDVGNVSGDTVIITLSEAVTAAIGDSSVFVLTESGNIFGLKDPFVYGGDTIKLPLDSSVNAETTILLSYTRPGTGDDIQDAAGNKLLTFSNQAVVNNVACDAVDVTAHYRFENNANSETGDNHATATGGATYDLDDKKEGSYGGNVDGTGRYFAIPSITYGNRFTISTWVATHSLSSTKTVYSALTSNDGFEINIDYDNDQIDVVTGDGSSITTANSSSGLTITSGVMHHLAVVFDNGVVTIYWDNSDVTSTSSTQSGFETTSVARIGFGIDGNRQLFGFVDDFHIYQLALSSANISTINGSPGTSLSIDDCGDPPTDSITVYWAEDWDDFSVTSTTSASLPVGIPNSDLEDHLTNFESLGSDDANDPDKADNVDIILYDGSNVLQSWYPDGQCCTGAWSDEAVANGGTGFDARANISEPIQYYPELYFSWNMFFQSGFVNPEGIKTPALYLEKAGPSGRIMVNDWTTNLDPVYYNWAYWNGYSMPIIYNANAKTDGWITTNTWINFTIRLVAGDNQTSNGLIELFIDGVFIGEGRYSIPYRNTDDPLGWSYIDISTFMGGATQAYTSPQDQWIYYDDLVVWNYNVGVDVPKGSTPSGTNPNRILNFPSEANFGR